MSRRPASRRPSARKKAKPRRASSAGQGLWSWLIVLGLVAGGIALYDNRASVQTVVSPYLARTPRATADDTARKKVAPDRAQAPARAKGPVPPEPVGVATSKAPVPEAKPAASTAVSTALSSPESALTGTDFKGRFYFCGTSGLDTCVVDGDTFWFGKTRITLADIAAPATDRAACQQERDRGFAAKVRLRDLLNAGTFDLEVLKGQPMAGAAPVMRVVTRDGRSLGSILVSEGLAKPRLAPNQSWCP